MSLIHTESWGAFGSYNGTDAYSTEVVAARNAHLANIARADYQVFASANTGDDTSGGFFIRPDPLYPTTRNALTHSSSAGSLVNLGVTAAVKKTLPITDKQIIIGFGLFIPADYVPNASNSTVPCFRMNVTIATDTGWYDNGYASVSAAKECFRVTDDLSVRWGVDAAQSSRKLKVGAMNYLEVRISAAEVSVWLDDAFLMQKAVSLVPQCAAFVFENNANADAGGTNMSGTPGRWALQHMYYMAVDGIAPQVRLGPTTRVYCSRPQTDVDVRFIRPAAAPTNASVAAQDIVDSPAQQLQSTTIGDFDTYGSTQSADEIRTMGLVHAVVSKALATNLEPDPHKIRPYVKYQNSGEGADAKTRELVTVISPTSRTIRAMTVRASDGSVWLVGDGQSVYRSGPNFDLSTWTKVREVGDGVNYLSILYDSGGILIGSSDGNVHGVPPGSNTIDTVAGTSPARLNPIAALFKSVDGTRYWGIFASGSNLTARYTTSPWSSTAWTAGPITNLPAAGSSFTYGPAITAGGRTLITRSSADDNVYVGNASNTSSVFVRPHGDSGVAYRALTWDGTQYLIGSTIYDGSIGGAPRIRRSLDTITWSLPTPAGSSLPGANVALNFGVSNTATGQSLFGGDQGGLTISADGINWRQLPRLTAKNLYAGVVLGNGDFLVGGQDGAMLRFNTPGADTTLYPLAGYKMAFGSSVFNPQTGAPWTPAEAADAQFGVRLTS